MFDREVQIKELEKEIDRMMESDDVDKEQLEILLDRLEDLLIRRADYYMLRIVK